MGPDPKAPYNKIAGFGVLATSADTEIRLAWDAFGLGNGLPSLDSFVSKMRSIRKSSDVNEYSFIGVRVLVEPVFLPKDQWFDPPEDWSPNIVSGKSYSTGTVQGQKLLDELQVRIGALSEIMSPRDNFPGLSEPPQAAFGSPTIVKPRLGQSVFRINVMRAYNFVCALTGNGVTQVLDAAHIRPFSDGGSHSIQNGLLLRKDIHSLFDAGLVAFDDEGRLLGSGLIASK